VTKKMHFKRTIKILYEKSKKMKVTNFLSYVIVERCCILRMEENIPVKPKNILSCRRLHDNSFKKRVSESQKWNEISTKH